MVCIQDTESFVRLHLYGSSELLIDIAIDVSPEHPQVVSIVGPTFHPEELAGRKLIALFDRAEARDFADVFALARRFSRELLLARAAEIDRGLNFGFLGSMMRTLDRFADDELPIESADVIAMRAFFRDWADELG